MFGQVKSQFLVLLIEDIHWSDESSLDFFHFLAVRQTIWPVTLIFSYRSFEIAGKLRSFLPGVPPSLENAKQIHLMTVGAYPDFHTQIEDLLAEGDKVVMRFTVTGTHQAEFMGIPATGVKIKVTGISIFRLDAGKIVEHWGEEDSLGWMQQLGAFPPKTS